MRSRTRIVAVGVGVAALAAIVPATSASAHHDTRTNLKLSVQEEGGRTYRVTLKCAPPRGSHPHRVDACREIKAANGDLRNLAGRQNTEFCSEIYRPVTVRAEGRSRGWKVSYGHTFGNSCKLAKATGTVFAFGR